MTRPLPPALLALLLVVSSGAAGRAEEAQDLPEALAGTSGAEALSIARELCEEVLEGRRSGFEGGARIEERVAARFVEFGLDPADSGGSYLEPLRFLASRVSGPASLALGEEPFTYERDFLEVHGASGGAAAGEAVFVGHGIHRPDLGYDDYASAAVEGRILVAMDGAPAALEGLVDDDAGLVAKARVAKARGAVALLLVAAGAAERRVRAPAAPGDDVPTLVVSEALADRLLAARETCVARERTAREGGRSGPPVATGLRLALETRVESVANATAHTALGAIPGRDPDLKDEVVLVACHLDHLGRDAAGRVLPGADASASGAAAIVHLADRLTENRWRPKRTIVFCGFAAGAQGHAGAEALARGYPFHGHVVCVLEIARVGRGEPRIVVSGGGEHPALERRVRAGLPSSISAHTQFALRGPREGAAAVFGGRGIPALHLSTGGASAPPPTPQDDGASLDATCLEAAVRTLGACVLAIGEETTPIAEPVGRGARALREGPRFGLAHWKDGLRLGEGEGARAAPAEGLDPRVGPSALVVEVRDADADAALAELARLSAETDGPWVMVATPGDAGRAHRSGRTALLVRIRSDGVMSADRLGDLARRGCRWIAPYGEPPETEEALRVARAARDAGVLLDLGPLGAKARGEVRAAIGAHPCVAWVQGAGEGEPDPHTLEVVARPSDLGALLAGALAQRPLCALTGEADPALEAAFAAWLAGPEGETPGAPRRRAARVLLGGNLLAWLARVGR
jgi:hypothetical protein